MSDDFGSKISRTLSPVDRQFYQLVMGKKKVPLDADLNMLNQIPFHALEEVVRVSAPSGFLVDPTVSRSDFQTSSAWSNYFILGNPDDSDSNPVVNAVVNGWLVPLAGTRLSTEGDVRNKVALYPPPATDSRFDFVFLEVWKALISANPSTTNKPDASSIWKYGNVEFGQTNLKDDLVDGEIKRETARRVQLQYRIRVYGQGSGLGSGASLDTYPDGLDDPNILGQGTASAPVGGFPFTNMHDELGDPGLWRAGDGASSNGLGTVDGYVYAIPICAVSRRNASTFTAFNLSGASNNNGAFNRNPSAALLSDPREGAVAFSTATLTSAITSSQTGAVQVDNLTGSGIDDSENDFTSYFIKIDDEIIQVSAADAAPTPGEITIPVGGRGRGLSEATQHAAGATVEIFTARPDGLFADEIADQDILDLRHAVNLGDWDYQRLLLSNLTKLLEGDLKTSQKTSSTGNTKGVSVLEVDLLHADGTVTAPQNVEVLDGPDGIRTVFSDAATIQNDVTLLLDPSAPLTGGFTTSQFDVSVTWDVGADFKPSGFINNLGVGGIWQNGSVIFLHIGGDDGTQGARATFRNGGERSVRFLSTVEGFKNASRDPLDGRQSPVTLRLLSYDAHHPIAPGEEGVDADAPRKHPGPFYPLQTTQDLSPFAVLGGVLHPTLRFTGLSSDSATTSTPGLVAGFEIDLGVSFDTAGVFYTLDANGNFENDPATVTVPLLDGSRTLWSMLTDDGRDPTGNSSEVFIVLYGDDAALPNNGLFKVVGAGTSGITTQSASNATSVKVVPLTYISGALPADFTVAVGSTLTAEFRSFYTSVEDGSGFALADPSLAIVLTDLEGRQAGDWNPWNVSNIGANHISNDASPLSSKLQLNCTLQYSSGRGATARVPENVWRVSVVNPGSEYLRQGVAAVDASFATAAGEPSGETAYDGVQLQLWNRLPSRGLTESSLPKAPSFGGAVVSFSEQDREHEVFLDPRSKTMVFRPFQNKSLTLQALTTNSNPSLVGATTYPSAVAKDGAAIFTAGLRMGFPIPSEFMPRFGRQDIPYHRDLTGSGAGTFLEGINHLFTDQADPTSPVFSIIGGRDNTTGGNLVTPMFFQTGSTSGLAYGVYGTIAGPATPAYQARLTTTIGTLTDEAREVTASLTSVQSSDLGAGLRGIQLPPYLGVARIYGVYDRDDFIAKGGGAYNADRVTPVADPPTNLLRKDRPQQTLFILQNGAKDLTLEDGDHTYIIPENALNLSLSPYYSAGTKDSLTDFEFVIEATVFGFAKNWINDNNYVLVRRNDGAGASLADGDDPEVAVPMTIPAAAGLNDRVYVGYTRTPYQGDPYMTREATSRTTSDYENRYGQIPVASAFELLESIEQFDSEGNIQIETPNQRPLEVLASADFFTTLGTGNMGGRLYAGTLMDVGHVESTPAAASRIPASVSQKNWEVRPYAFTRGQSENTSRATLKILFNTNPGAGDRLIIDLPGEEVTSGVPTYVEMVATVGVPATDEQFQIGGDADATIQNLIARINVHPIAQYIVGALYAGSATLDLVSWRAGAFGNAIKITWKPVTVGGTTDVQFMVPFKDRGAFGKPVSTHILSASLSGGSDDRVNAGTGTTQIRLTGMTEQLPLGILLQDSDFIGENILGDASSALKIKGGAIQPQQSVLPLSESGTSYDRFLGDPGTHIVLTDGAILRYEGFNSTAAPTGTKRFRLYRGGGSVYILSDRIPGGPVDWISESYPPTLRPILKGGVLACKALLVRNYRESAFGQETSHGNEIQMVILTYGILGNGSITDEGLEMEGVISPTGYGEGYAAADRYRLESRPLYHGYSQKAPDTSQVKLAIFPGRGTEE